MLQLPPYYDRRRSFIFDEKRHALEKKFNQQRRFYEEITILKGSEYMKLWFKKTDIAKANKILDEMAKYLIANPESKLGTLEYFRAQAFWLLAEHETQEPAARFKLVRKTIKGQMRAVLENIKGSAEHKNLAIGIVEALNGQIIGDACDFA